MADDNTLDFGEQRPQESVETMHFQPIKGYPMLQWKGKRPFRSTQFYPAQLKEQHGQPVNDWLNEIYWGDNLQVMSHLLKKYRGQVQLVYIDPPFDSKADYRLKIRLRGKQLRNDLSSFEEKQYSDVWVNDEYLQFIFERIVLLRELLRNDGLIFLHCDSTKGHYLKCIMDEVFGSDNFRNQVVWKRSDAHNDSGQGAKHLGSIHDMILIYSKTNVYRWNDIYLPLPEKTIRNWYKNIEEGTGRKFNKADVTGPEEQ